MAASAKRWWLAYARTFTTFGLVFAAAAASLVGWSVSIDTPNRLDIAPTETGQILRPPNRHALTQKLCTDTA